MGMNPTSSDSLQIVATANGRKIISRRRAKGRKKLIP